METSFMENLVASVSAYHTLEREGLIDFLG